MTKEEVIKIVSEHTDNYALYIKQNHIQFYEQIKSEYTGLKFGEKLYRYVYGNDVGICPISQKPTKFISFQKGFSKYHSNKEAAIATGKQKRETAKKTLMEKYGVDHPSKLQSVKDKIKEHRKNGCYDNAVKKQKETMLEKYGVEHAWSNGGAGREKMKETCFQKYGDKNFNNRKKMTNTFIERYGMKIHPNTLKSVLERLKNNTLGVTSEQYKNYLSDNNIKNPSQLVEVSQKKSKIAIEKMLNCIFDGDRLKNKVIPLFSRNEYVGCSRDNKYKFECNICKTHFEDVLSGGKIPVCPTCYPHIRSLDELEVLNYIKSLIPNEEILHNTRKTVDNEFELDIYIPSKQLAIEYNGLYWHSEISGDKDKRYHLNKTVRCKDKGIRLIHIFENDWLDKQEIIKSMLCNLLNVNTTPIYARKCEVVELDNKEKDLFVLNNHIQGRDKGSIRIGLKYNNEIVSVMTFCKSRFDKNVEYEMSRYCNKLFTNVVGGAGKLFNYFIKTYNPKSIVSYCDRKVFIGKVYENIGFKFHSNTPPNYYYTDYKTTFNRIRFQKHKLSKILEKYDPVLSEWDNMKNNDYDRIWDCGNLKFVWESSLKK
jgi:hypothetical protein